MYSTQLPYLCNTYLALYPGLVHLPLPNQTLRSVSLDDSRQSDGTAEAQTGNPGEDLVGFGWGSGCLCYLKKEDAVINSKL